MPSEGREKEKERTRERKQTRKREDARERARQPERRIIKGKVEKGVIMRLNDIGIITSIEMVGTLTNRSTNDIWNDYQYSVVYEV